MKKTTLLFAFLLVSFLSQAQIVASQNFDAALGWTTTTTTSDAGTTINAWARRTTGGAPVCSPFAGAGMARFNSYNIPAAGTGRLTSPAITFAGATYRVKLKMFRDSGYPTDADNIKVYYNTTAAAGGTLLGTVNRSIQLAPVVAADGWYAYTFDIPGNITGTGYINILGTSQYGNNIFIDEITVEQIQPVDAEMSSVNMNAIVAAGSKVISGVIKNMGTTAITAMDVKWQIGNGTIYTQSLSGLNIAAGQTYNYSHTDQWNATPGSYSLKVWVANVNGQAVDGDATNDMVTKSVAVASGSTTRLPLYEKFSSSTCGPCYSFNTNYFSPFYTTGTNHDNLALICYQVNWPGTGDPYYTAEVGERVAYYGVTGAPTLYVDSKEGTNFNTAQLQSALNAEMAEPAYFAINASRLLNGTDLTVNITTTPYLTGTYTVHAVVVERITTGNVATNGETSFKNVMMKMLPDPSGTSVNFTYDTPNTFSLQASLTGLNIEEMSDIDVVVFVQNTATKAVMQAAYATDALANNQFQSNAFATLYPNPSNGIVQIASEDTVSVEITDMTGKVVFKSTGMENGASMNLTSLQKGVYVAKMTNTTGATQSQKIVLN
ncbi:T9SS type A sorting domain-containing protein [Flavobacterium sp. N1719]|uniref:T9SS type A sorting domain-containing protein n=1 Tax=Flavobacterium sp. N1719 TaxID=2885633 RepID=UPI0022220897|nr:T9SS type A sorting domain-containing protein [Flavobacterium sp. N1719]